jgi:hypothetical protein
VDWCKGNQISYMNGNLFGADIVKRGFEKKRVTRGWIYKKIGLLEDGTSPQGGIHTGTSSSSSTPHDDVPTNVPAYMPSEATSEATLDTLGCQENVPDVPTIQESTAKLVREDEISPLYGVGIHRVHSPILESGINPPVECVDEIMYPHTQAALMAEVGTLTEQLSNENFLPEHRDLLVRYEKKVSSLPVNTPTWQAPDSGYKNTMFGKNEHIKFTKSLLKSGDFDKTKAALEAMQRTLGEYGEGRRHG